jgi:hypothetical protein
MARKSGKKVSEIVRESIKATIEHQQPGQQPAGCQEARRNETLN